MQTTQDSTTHTQPKFVRLFGKDIPVEEFEPEITEENSEPLYNKRICVSEPQDNILGCTEILEDDELEI